MYAALVKVAFGAQAVADLASTEGLLSAREPTMPFALGLDVRAPTPAVRSRRSESTLTESSN